MGAIDPIPVVDPSMAYREALTAYGAMVDELRGALGAIDLPDDQHLRLTSALSAVFSARAMLDREQYKRMEALIVNEQLEMARMVDSVIARIGEIEHEQATHVKKLDQIIDLLVGRRK
jgi:hypothetical protein